VKIKDLVSRIRFEAVPSYGCTEPAAIALAVARTCSYLRNPVKRLTVIMGANIYKNAYNVTIPNTKKSGVSLASALGILLAGRADTLEIFSSVDQALIAEAEQVLSQGIIEIRSIADGGFYIEVLVDSDGEYIHTLTKDYHDNLVKVEKNGEVIFELGALLSEQPNKISDFTQICIDDLADFCATMPIDEIQFIKPIIEMNWQVSVLGQSIAYGLGIGHFIKNLHAASDLEDEAHADLCSFVKAAVGAAADYRMSGGNAPVMTLFGSGNQGIMATLPTCSVAVFKHLPEARMLRAVTLSILLTMIMKSKVGRLSPICGASLAGAASAGAIVWLLGGSAVQIEGAVQNIFGSLSGMICDGAKEGCALKLACCAGEAVMAAQLALGGIIIQATNGIVGDNVEETVNNVARLAGQGMDAVDKTIISILHSKELGRRQI
jgi:L-cysteine desulfidase